MSKTTSIQNDKIALAKRILEIENASIIKQVNALLNLQESDWWESISSNEQKSILKGISQLDKGQGKSHKEVMKKYKKWL